MNVVASERVHETMANSLSAFEVVAKDLLVFTGWILDGLYNH